MSATSTKEQTQRGLDLTFATSFVTTLIVAVAPTFVAFGFLVWARPDPHVFLAMIASVLLTAAAFAAGSKIWANQPESFGYSFADLMLWHWVRREWAEEKLVRNARVLGYDRQGRFIGKNDISPERQLAAARAIGAALDAKSSYTIEHSKRVEKHARDMAVALGLNEEETQELATAAALHDIGNLRVPEHVIRKAGELTLEERSTIEGHVLLGAIMAFDAGGETVVRGVRHHHERWDGNGYPSGLKGDKIPLFARVIGIAEAYDAMTSTRPYRQSFTQDQAVTVLREESGSQFDAALVETFVKTLPEPLEIVERFPFLAWAQRQLHELRILFRRVGAVAMSAAASTIAIALILGTAVIKPDVFNGGSNGDTERLPRNLAEGDTQDRVLGERLELALTDANGTVTEYQTVLSDQARGRTVDSSLRGDVIDTGDDETDSNGPDGSDGDGDGDSDGDTDGPAQGDGDGNGRGNGNVDRPDVVVNDSRGGGGGRNSEPDPTPSPTETINVPGDTVDNDDDDDDDNDEGGQGNGNGKGKGKGRENAPGQNKDKGKPDHANGRGNSENAPGQNKDKGKPESAPGQVKDKGAKGTGNSGEAPGNSEGKGKNNDGWAESGKNGNSDTAPGNSGSSNAGGNSDSGSSSSPGNSGSSNAGGNSDSGSSSSGSSDSPGNSGSSNAGGNSDSGSSNSSPGNSGGNSNAGGNSDNGNGNGNGNGHDKDKGPESAPEAPEA